MRGDLLSLVLVAPLVFRAPPVVSGRAARCARGRRPTHEPSVPRAFGPPNWWCCLWPYGCCGRRMARPPARLGGLTSFGAAPRSPPVPSRPSGALHTSGVFVADVARCVGSLSGQVPPPTCTAAKLAGSPGAFHTCGAWCAGVWFGALSWYPARPCHRPRAPQPGAAHVRCVWVLQARWPGGLKPRSPLLACACVGLKPSSPLRVRNGRFWCVFRAQRCRRFQRPLVGACSCVVGFIVAMFLCPVRDVCRPAQPDVGASAKKFTLCRSWMQRGARGWRRWGFCTT